MPIDHGLWQLAGTDPTLPQDDLEPLRHLIGGAKFVGLGESFHMSGGFYRMKDRVFRFLVQKMGFRVFGIESSWIGADLVEQYIQTCQGTPDDALLGLFEVWNSTETRALVRWMCEWNTAHPNDRVHFYGFDNQTQTLQSAEALIAFLQRIGVAAGDPRIAGIRACDGAVERYYPRRRFPPELYQQCQDALTGVAALFDSQERAIEIQTSKEDLAWARIHLVGQRSWQEQIFYGRTDFYRSYAARDRGMAYTAQEIHRLRFPHARTVLWAHNGHIVENGGPSSPFVLTTLGTFLDADLGNQYFTIALTAFNTDIDWGVPEPLRPRRSRRPERDRVGLPSRRPATAAGRPQSQWAPAAFPGTGDFVLARRLPSHGAERPLRRRDLPPGLPGGDPAALGARLPVLTATTRQQEGGAR